MTAHRPHLLPVTLATALAVIALASPAIASPALASPALADDAPANTPPAPADTTPTITVTARLDKARDSIQTSVGANDYQFNRAALDIQPGGTDSAMKAVLLQAPGVAQDDDGDGAIHIRNEHGNIQYRLNGITVPDSFSGFGALVDTRVAESIEVITGALPAQYGYRTAGIVNMKTRTSAYEAGGDIGVQAGGNHTFAPSGTFHDSFGQLNVFLSASYLANDQGLESPTAQQPAIHDDTRQFHGFGYLSWLIDDKSRLSFFGGSAISRYQIPNIPGETTTPWKLEGSNSFNSANLDQNRRQTSHFGVLTYQYSGDAVDIEVAPFIRWAKAHYTPDPNGGNLMYEGTDTDLSQTDTAAGLQADVSWHAGPAHTIRAGLYYGHESASTLSINRVFTLDANGNQTSDTPETIPVGQSSAANTIGLYLQDEWEIARHVTLNYGLRYDRFHWQLTEDQLSPRAGLVWKPAHGTTIHAGYARYFTPPPLLQLGVGALTAFQGTTGAAANLTADPVRAEREHNFDIGAQQIIARHLTLGIDTYAKIKRNLLDDTVYGATELVAPFNYAKSYSWGVELSANYARGPFELYGNVARGEQKGKAIVSNQFFFSAAELAYIANHYIYTDHSQKWTASAGGSAKIADPWGSLRPSFDLLYGSGLRKSDDSAVDPASGDPIPNGAVQSPYVQVNLGVAQVIGANDKRALTLRLDVTNLFDHVYLLHDGSGVGAGRADYGPRRALLFSIRKAF